MRDSAGLAPDFAGLNATPGITRGVGKLNRLAPAVKPHHPLRYSVQRLWHTGRHAPGSRRAGRPPRHRRGPGLRRHRQPDPDTIQEWSQRFGLLSDPTRLSLLLCISAAGPISVTDLAVAVDQNPDTVSQTLRLLRAHRTVTTRRDGRVIRYQLADPTISQLLELAAAPTVATQ